MFPLLHISLALSLSCSVAGGANSSVFTVCTDTSHSTSEKVKTLNEAERNQFTTRRIVLCCWTSIPDQEIRQRVVLIEGDVFKQRALALSLRRLSQFKAIESVLLKDVEVRINREEKTIDFTIHIKERRDSH